MVEARSAYASEFRRAAIDTGLARELPEFEIIEVFAPIDITVRQKQRVEGGEGWKVYSTVTEYRPGQVLHREWRTASKWESEEWQGLSDEQLRELGVFAQDGRFSIQRVVKIKDLDAAIRRNGRHIPASNVFRQRRRFELAGHAQILSQYASQLNNLIQNSLQAPRPTTREREQMADELSEIYQELERRRTVLIARARQEIGSALQGEYWEVQARTGQAVAYILADRARDYEMALKSLALALKWRLLKADIERRFRNCYNRLGELGKELQDMLGPGRTIPPLDLLRIASEAHGIWLHLRDNVPNINPYSERLQHADFQSLSRVVPHAQDAMDRTVLNDVVLACEKLEAVAMGDRPTRAEISREKGSLF